MASHINFTFLQLLEPLTFLVDGQRLCTVTEQLLSAIHSGCNVTPVNSSSGNFVHSFQCVKKHSVTHSQLFLISDSAPETVTRSFRWGGVSTSSQLHGNVFKRKFCLCLELQCGHRTLARKTNTACTLASCYSHHDLLPSPFLFTVWKIHSQTHTHGPPCFAATDNISTACSI